MRAVSTELTFRPTPLDKCLFGFGLPLSRADFLRDIGMQCSNSFAKSFRPGLNDRARWAEYEREVVRPARRVLDFAKDAGVCVIENFSLRDLKRAPGFDVVSIVGHWLGGEEKVELADGMHTVTDFVSAVPAHTECMLDLMICRSAVLLSGIKKRFGGSIIVCGNSIGISLQICLWVYESTVRKMTCDECLNFLDALTSVKKEIIDSL